jgi:DNA polymerase I-like protein with 3'-5' exonuclease and polymerase domains
MIAEFNGKEIKIELWDGRRDPLTGNILSIDTETLPIVRGEPPVPATLQVYWPKYRFVQIVQGDAIPDYTQKMLQCNIGAEMVFHNFCFDYEVLGGRNNHLLYEALENGRITDTGIRYLLKRMDDGKWYDKAIPRWGLDAITKELLDITLDKDESIRLTFTPDQPLSPNHILYAGLDPVATMECWKQMPYAYATEQIQLKASVVLNRMSMDGFAVDIEMFDKMQKMFQEKSEQSYNILRMFGYLPKVKGNRAVQQEILANIEKRSGKVFPRSAKKGDIQVGKALAPLFEGEKMPTFLDAWTKAAHYEKLQTTYFNREYLCSKNRMHARFNTLVKTGRTSSSKPNLCI